MIRFAATAILAATLAACGSAVGKIPIETLGITARDAYVEARSVAASWAPDARLRWVEGEGISPEGIAPPNSGSWSFHYTAPSESRELFVRVGALATESEERPVTGPPGYVIGDNALSTAWIDSREAVAAVQAGSTTPLSAPFSMLLIPTRPTQWVVRGSGSEGQRHVDAGTGEVLLP